MVNKKNKIKKINGKKINSNHFRVTIFGSARLKPKDTTYKLVEQLARMIAEDGLDIVTGGKIFCLNYTKYRL